jgi:integrase
LGIWSARQTPPKVGKIPHFPRLTENNVREGFLEHDEFLALRGAAADHLKVAMTIGYYTGMRMREIIGVRGVRWEQVNLEEGSIRLSSNQTKTKCPRVIYMPDDFRRVMEKAKEFRDRQYPYCPYVCHIEGRPYNHLIYSWKTACRRIGLSGITFHDLRANRGKESSSGGCPRNRGHED